MLSRRQLLEVRIADYRRVITQLETNRAALLARRPKAPALSDPALAERLATVQRTLNALRDSLAAAEDELQREAGPTPSARDP